VYVILYVERAVYVRANNLCQDFVYYIRAHELCMSRNSLFLLLNKKTKSISKYANKHMNGNVRL